MNAVTDKVFQKTAAGILVMLLGITSAYAALDYISEGLELKVSEISMPPTQSSSMSVKPCDECDRLTLQVKESTTYIIKNAGGNQAVSLSAFKSAMLKIGAAESQVLVFYIPDTNVVTEMRLSQ